jgi:hypothetical protein
MSENQNAKTALLIPAGQALVTGIFSGAAAGILTNLAAWPEPWSWAAGVGAAGGFGAWLLYRSEWAERLTPKPPQPVAQFQTQTITRIQVVGPAGSFQGAWAEFDIEPAKLRRAALRVLAAGSFSLSTLGGAGKPLSRAEFENLRAEFIKRGLAVWVNPDAHSQGCVLTLAGKAVIKRLASPQVDPTQEADRLQVGRASAQDHK